MGGNVEWTKPEGAKLKALAEAGADPDEFERSLPGRSWDAARHKMHGLGLDVAWREKREPVKDVTPHQAPDFGTLPAEPVDVMGFLDEAERRKKNMPKATDYWRIAIETDVPIAIMKAADFHFGGLDIDYPSLKDHIAFLLDVPQMYAQFYGDLTNHMIQHRVVGARRDIMGPNEQIDFDKQLINDTLDRGKLLSVGSGTGTHDESHIERTSGISLIQLLCMRKVPYFRGMGYIDLVLRTSDGTEQTYRQGFVHQVRFHSFMNPLHGAKRMQQLHAEFFGRDRPICHEYVVAHTHYPAHSTEGLAPEDRVHLIKVGTFKTDCKYSQRRYGQGRIGVPTIVYHPDRHESVCLHTPWEAHRYMTGRDWA